MSGDEPRECGHGLALSPELCPACQATPSPLPAGWERYVRECPSCPRRVLWALLDSGKRMPCDPALDPAGTVAVWRDGAGTLRGRVISKARPVASHEQLLVTHWATCANPPGRPRGAAPANLPPNVVSIDVARRRRRRR